MVLTRLKAKMKVGLVPCFALLGVGHSIPVVPSSVFSSVSVLDTPGFLSMPPQHWDLLDIQDHFLQGPEPNQLPSPLPPKETGRSEPVCTGSRNDTPAPEGSPCVDNDGVLVESVVHTDLQVHSGPRHPDWHVDSNTRGPEI